MARIAVPIPQHGMRVDTFKLHRYEIETLVEHLNRNELRFYFDGDLIDITIETSNQCRRAHGACIAGGFTRDEMECFRELEQQLIGQGK